MAAMFSNTRSTASSSGHIVEFKAGRSRLDTGSGETTRKVVAEPTKGLVYIKQSNDMLIHFCWKDRETGALVDDLIIFPDDAEFKAVNGCPDGKVFMLKFKSSGEMKLFWLQDSTPDVDKDLVKKVNDALNKPPTSRPSASRSSNSNSNADRPSAGGSLIAGPDFNAPLGGLDQGQLMSLIQSLQGNSDTLPITHNETGRQQKKDVNVSLADALSNETAAEVARNHADELTPHLPPSDDPAKELSDTVRTPQFRQAADTLGHALQTGQLGPVLSQFGMNDEIVASANKGDVREFVSNLTQAEGGNAEPTDAANPQITDDDTAREPEPKRNRPDNEDMDVD